MIQPEKMATMYAILTSSKIYVVCYVDMQTENKQTRNRYTDLQLTYTQIDRLGSTQHYYSSSSYADCFA